MKQATALIATIACAQATTLSTESTLSLESTLSVEATTMVLPEPDISTGPYYWGPNYPFPGFNNVALLPGSTTWDRARGSMQVRWSDWYNVEHLIDFSSNHDAMPERVFFPVMGRSWNWRDGDGWERTGYNESCKWVQATLWPMRGRWWEDDYVRIESSCYRFVGEPIGSTALSEVRDAMSQVADIAADASEIVQSGVNIAENILQVASNIRASAGGIRR